MRTVTVSVYSRMSCDNARSPKMVLLLFIFSSLSIGPIGAGSVLIMIGSDLIAK